MLMMVMFVRYLLNMNGQCDILFKRVYYFIAGRCCSFYSKIAKIYGLKKCKVEVAVTDSNCVTDINSNLGLL